MTEVMAGADIRARREALGWSQEQLADRVGTKQQTIQRIETGETQFSRYLSAIEKALLDAESAAAPRFITNDSADDVRGHLRSPPTQPATGVTPPSQLKIYAAVEGGGGVVIVSNDPVEYRPVPHYLATSADAYGVFVVSDSMAPRYEPGEVAEVAPHKPVRPGGDVILFGKDAQGDRRAMLKRLVRSTETEWHLEQFNPPRKFVVSKADWPIAHVVVGRGPA